MLVKSRGGTEVHTSPVPEAGKRLRGGGGGQWGVRGGTREGERGPHPGSSRLYQGPPAQPPQLYTHMHFHMLCSNPTHLSSIQDFETEPFQAFIDPPPEAQKSVADSKTSE